MCTVASGIAGLTRPTVRTWTTTAVGRITAEALEAAGVPIDGVYYLCGPTAFMDSLREGLAALGVAIERVHTEMFGTQGSLTPGVVAGPKRPPHQPEGAPGTGTTHLVRADRAQRTLG